MIIKPSNLYRVSACPGSTLFLTERKDYKPSESSLSGTIEHEVLHYALTGKSGIEEHCNTKWGVLPTQDMFERVDEFVEHVEGFNPKSELKVLIPIKGMDYGYIDVVYEPDEPNTIVIVDYKSGHVQVEAIGNLQLISYAIALAALPEYANVTKFYTTIWQHGAVRTDWYDRNDLLNWQVKIEAIVKRAGTPELNTGTHCTGCPNATVCPVLKAASCRALRFEDLPETPQALSEALDEASLCKELASIRVKSLESVIIDKLKEGIAGFNYYLKPSAGRLAWTHPKVLDKLKELSKILGKVLVNEEPITPTQALKLKVPKEIIDKMAARKPGGTSLVKIDFNSMFGE